MGEKMGLFDSIIKLTSDVVEITTAPIRIAADATSVVIAPVKKLANEVANEVEQVADDLRRDLE